MTWNWKLILLRILLNGIAISLTAIILPGITLEKNNLSTFLLLGIAIAILNAFVRPVVEFFTLSLLFVTYGLVVIFINAVMLVFLSWIFPDTLILANIWAALIGGTVMGLVSQSLENLLGLNPPIIDYQAYNGKRPERATFSKLVKNHGSPVAAKQPAPPTFDKDTPNETTE